MRNFREAFSTFTYVSSILSVLLSVGYILTLISPQSKTFLVLVPGKVSFALWTCLTSSFVVVNSAELLIDICALIFICKIIEPVYGALELLKLVAIVAGLTGISTFSVAYTTFVIGRSASALYVRISGFHGLLGALLVCFKQVAPDHQLLICDAVNIKAQWLPSIYTLLGVFIGLAYQPLNFYPFLLFGTYYAWFYLRFLQVDQNTKLKGDPSPSFSFASFFPEFMQGSVNKVSIFCSSVFHIKSGRRNESVVLPVSVRSESDEHSADQARRRERGKKAVEARLGVSNGQLNAEIAQIQAHETEPST